MSQNIRRKLRDPDPAVRRAAIMTLGKSKDRAALPLLKAVHETDPDPALRQLAAQAGRYIQQQAKAAPPAPPPPAAPRRVLRPTGSFGSAGVVAPPPPSFDFYGPPKDEPEDFLYSAYDTYAEEKAPPGYIIPPTDEDKARSSVPWGTEMHPYRSSEVVVSAADKSKARENLKGAARHYKAGRSGEAYDLLIVALTLNPGLTGDPEAQTLAGNLIDLPPIDAVEALASPARRGLYPRPGKGRRAAASDASRSAAQGATWTDVLIDLGILFMVVMVSVIGLLLVLRSASGPMFDQFGREVASQIAIFRDILSLPVAFGVTIAIAAYDVLISLIGIGVIYYISSRMLGGRGTLVETYHALIPVRTVLVLLETGGVILGLVISGGSPQMLSLFMFVVIAIGGIYFQMQRLASVHGYGMGSGCLALVLGSLVLGIFGCTIGLFLQAILLQATLF